MAKARVFELSKSIPPVPEVPGQKREKWFFLDKPLSWMSISIPRCFGWHMQHLCGALLLSLLGLRGSGRFPDRRVCSLTLFALAFQAQFDEVLPKLALVRDSSLQP